jgi:choloylglycine hydrolase
MNEKGLVVEIMWLNDSRYPAKDARPSLNELQWIQYHLDNHATVAEVVASAPKLRVAPAYAKVHYMACDAGGACATFEYLGGKLVVHEGEGLPAPALTNHPYDESVAYLRKAGAEAPPGRGSLPRFARAAKAAESKEKGDPKERALKLLDSVSQGSYTKWNIVYDPKNLSVHFRTYDAKGLKTLNVAEVAASCKQAPVALDMNDRALEGDVTKSLTPMTLQRNRDLVKKSLAGLGGALPAPLVEALVVYPSTLRCAVE